MRKVLVFFTVLALILVPACSSGTETDTPAAFATELTVEIKTVGSVSLAPDGKEIITVSAEYPEIANPEGSEAIDAVNAAYLQNANAYIGAVKTDFDERAAAAYEDSPEEFKEYSFVQKCSVTYNRNGFLSIKRDYSEIYGDYDCEEIYADVYDMTSGRVLNADEVISASGGDILKILFLGYTSVAEEYPERFKDNYIDILNSAIDQSEFYLTDTAAVFVLQPGIATYSEYGCLMFEMPYKGNEVYFTKLNRE